MKRAVLVAVAVLCVAGSAFADGVIGSGTRSGLIGSGTRTEDPSTTEDERGGYLGSGNIASEEEGGGGTIGSGTRSGQITGSGARIGTNDQVMGSGGRTAGAEDGYFGSGNSVREYRLFDGQQYLRVLVGVDFILTIPE